MMSLQSKCVTTPTQRQATVFSVHRFERRLIEIGALQKVWGTTDHCTDLWEHNTRVFWLPYAPCLETKRMRHMTDG